MIRLYATFLFIIVISISLLFLSLKSLIISNDSWLNADNPLEQQEKFTENTFKLHHGISIAIVQDKALKNNKNIFKDIKIIKEKFMNNISLKKFIQEIKTPFDLTQTFTDKNKQLVIKNSFEIAESKNIPLKDILELNRNNPYSSVFFGKNDKTFFFKILTHHKLSFKEQQIFFVEINNIINNNSFFKTHYITGDLYINYISNKKTLENLKLISSIVVIIIFLFLLVYLRNIVSVLIITTPAFLCLSISFYLLVLLSEKITIISIIVPCSAFIIALSDSIHIFFRSLTIDKKAKSQFILFKIYIKKIFFPCFITSLTTAIGFIAFCLSDITHLQDFSYIAAPIIMINFLVVVIVTSLLSAINPRTCKLYAKASSLFSPRFFNYKNIILIITALLFLNTFALNQLEIEGNFINMFFKKKSRVKRDLDFFDNNFYGSMDLSLVVKTKKKDFFKSIKNYQKITNLKDKISLYPEIKKILSYQEQIQLIHQELKPSTNHPENNDELEQELFFLNLSTSDKELSSLASYVTFDYQTARIHIITKQLSIKRNNELIKKIEKELKYLFPQNDLFISGSIKTNNTISIYILETQFMSIGISVGVIFLLSIFYFGLKMSLIAMIPNLLPLLSVLSIIAYLGISLDISVVLLVAISFSFCVDNSSHFIHYYKHLSSDQDQESNLLKSLNTLFRPFFLTVIILIIGLGSFIFSDLLLLERFGTFSAFTIALSFFFDMLVLPVLIKQFIR